jgi:hypothetical protein
MAERPYVAGAVAIGVVAAALHLGTTPAPTASPSPGSSGGAHVRRSLQGTQSPFDKVFWEAEMKGHPENLGKLSAQEELASTLSDFYSTATGADDRLPKPIDSGVPPDAIEVMIAIEPDPVHTHLALFFDRDMDALEDALQASCYQYQSNWLPWSPPSSAPSSTEHFAAQEEQRLFLQGRESYPGVILFRGHTCNPPPPLGDGDQSASPVQKPLAVFLVGNSPTAGIDHTQFEEAVHQIGILAPQQRELNILGPTFSGSGRSLQALLSGKAIATLKNLDKITIASGSVTDSYCQDFLPRAKIDTDCNWSSQDRPAISFVSFGVDKDWRSHRIKEFLHKQGQFEPEEIADLTEDESSYGSTAHKRATDDPYPHLYFPRNISHLRSAYQNSNIFGFGVSTSGAGNVSLSLNFNETSDDDTVPNFAEQQMPVSQDGVMREITQTIERRHIKVVVLSATDVLDAVFVAEILAREAPNTLVIVNQADNLFLRSGSPNDFANMYFVSPFPLIHQDRPRGAFFPSDDAESLYAATHFFYPPPDHNTYMPFSYSGLTGNPPPLWLSAVGHGDYWPVALLNDPGSPPASFHRSSVVNQPANALVMAELPHLSQDLLLLCLCLIALYHTAKCFGLSALRDFSYAYTINDAVLRLPKLWLQLGITLLLLVAFQLSLTPACASSPSKVALYTGGAVLSLAATYLICSIIPVLDPPALWPADPKSKKRIAGILVIALLLSYGLWRLLWYWLSVSSNFREFFEYRASYPLRGVSPVFPFFLTIIAFCILLYNHLDRIAFTENLRPRLPKIEQDLPNCPGDCDLMPVTRLLHWPPGSCAIRFKSVLLALVAAFALVCVVLFNLRPLMFDGSMLEWSFGVAMFLLIVAVLWELVMAAVLWWKLKTLCLERLESSSLRRGFSSIRGFTWSSLWIFRGSRSARYRAIFRLLEQARDALSDEAALVTDGNSLKKSVEKLKTAIASEGPQSIGEAFGDVQIEIAVVAGRLLCKLKTAWRNEKGTITACDATGDEEKSTPSSGTDEPISTEQLVCEEWVALVYIHYVRMVLLQIRSRLVTAAILYLFLVWAGTSYPYLNRHALLIALAVILGILSFAVILIYASINRDPILSRTTNHTPGQLDLDFYLKTASLVGVPLIGFVASQFPEVSSFLFSWLEPGMAAVK